MIVEALAGAAAGLLARYVVPDSPGIGADTLFGFVGGGLAAFLYKRLGTGLSFDAFDAHTIAVALAGGITMVIITRMTAGRRTVV